MIIAKIVHGKKLDKYERTYVDEREFSTKSTILFVAIVCILIGLACSILLCLGMAILFFILFIPEIVFIIKDKVSKN